MQNDDGEKNVNATDHSSILSDFFGTPATPKISTPLDILLNDHEGGQSPGISVGSHVKDFEEKLDEDIPDHCELCGEPRRSGFLRQCCNCGYWVCFTCSVKEGERIVCKRHTVHAMLSQLIMNFFNPNQRKA